MRAYPLILALASCGDNFSPDAMADALGSLPYVELPTIDGYNHASETQIAAFGNDVVVTTTDQSFPSANSFVYPPVDDPDHPFRMVVYATSHDSGASFSAPRVLVPTTCTDPLMAASADGSFWGGCNNPNLPNSYLLRSTDAGDTFAMVANPPISDKGWITIDNTRHALWMTGAGASLLFGFDGTELGNAGRTVFGVSGGVADAAGLHYISDDGFWIYTWDGINFPVMDSAHLPEGDIANGWTRSSASMGQSADGRTWIVRAIHDTALGSPVVVRFHDAGVDFPISPLGTVGFLPAAAMDDAGRLHAAWYDSSGPTGHLVYTHSTTTDLLGSYTEPIIVDAEACPGGGWYPYSPSLDPPGGRRLREYIGIAIAGTRAFISWTHAPDPPSRVRIASIDF